MMGSDPYTATITAREQLADSLAVFRVRPDADPRPFTPGQYLTLGRMSGTRLVQRAYSVASSARRVIDGYELYIRLIPGGALTGAVNGGLNALVRGLALELAPIRVNTVSPGWVETPIWEEIMPDTAQREARFQAMREKIPARRIGQPDDIAHAIETVIHNGFMSGSTLYVDGGQRLV